MAQTGSVRSVWRSPLIWVDRKSQAQGQTDEIHPERTQACWNMTSSGVRKIPWNNAAPSRRTKTYRLSIGITVAPRSKLGRATRLFCSRCRSGRHHLEFPSLMAPAMILMAPDNDGEASLSSGRRPISKEPDPSGYPELRWATWRRFDPSSSPSAIKIYYRLELIGRLSLKGAAVPNIAPKYRNADRHDILDIDGLVGASVPEASNCSGCKGHQHVTFARCCAVVQNLKGR